MRFSLQFAKYLAIATVEKNIGQDVRALLRRLKEKPCFQIFRQMEGSFAKHYSLGLHKNIIRLSFSFPCL